MVFNDATGLIVGGGGTVYYTNDSGASWTTQNVGITVNLNSASILDAQNLVVSDSRFFFVSSDGGQTWIQKNLPDNRINKTTFLNENLGHAVSDTGEIFKTVDGGENWYITADYSNLFPNNFRTIYFFNENIGFASRENAELFKTTDGGETWVDINISTSNIFYEIQFITENIGFSAAEFGVYKTTDGGNSWNRIGVDKDGFFANTDMFGVFFFDENRGFSVGEQGRISQTSNSGDSWTDYTTFKENIDAITFTPTDRGILRVDGDLYESTNNGEDWTFLSSPKPGGDAKNVTFLSDQLGFCIAGGTPGTSSDPRDIYKTSDGGISWVKPTNAGINTNNPVYALSFANENVGYASGDRTYKTTDGGETWAEVLEWSLSQLQFFDTNTGYGRQLGQNPRIFKTADGGQNWMESLHIENGFANNMFFINEQEGFVVGENGLGRKTLDGGNTWVDLNLPFGDFDRVVFFNANVGYVIEDGGEIFKTENGGLIWTRELSVFGLSSIAKNNSNQLFATGSGGKVYRDNVALADLNVITQEALNVSAISAEIPVIFALNMGSATNLRLEVGQTVPINEEQPIAGSIPLNGVLQTNVLVGNLSPETEYFYRAVGTVGGVDFFSRTRSFTTPRNFNFGMYAISGAGATTADIPLGVESNNLPITEISVEYGTSPGNLNQIAPADITTVSNGEGFVFPKAALTALEPATEYFVRGRALYNGEVIYTNVRKFTTLPEFRIVYRFPTFSGDLATISASVWANLADLEEVTFEYGTLDLENELPASTTTIPVNSSRFVSATLPSLDPNELHYYRIRAKQGDEIIYGYTEYLSFIPRTILTIDPARDITENSSTVDGRIFCSDFTLTGVAIEYGTNGEFTEVAFGNTFGANRSVSEFLTVELTNLLPGTTYNYRLRARKSSEELETVYSDVGTFTTLAGFDKFATTWKTDLEGESNNNQIIIPTFPGETYNYSVDWGDGNIDSGITGDATHEYAVPGIYTVKIEGVFPRIYFNGVGDKTKLISIDKWGEIQWSSFEDAFNGCRFMDIQATDSPDLSGVTNLDRAFGGCESLIGNDAMNNWDVSAITSMIATFSGTDRFDQFLGDWDISNVTEMSGLFFFAEAYNQDLSNWDVSNVISMTQLFQEASSFNQDLSGWDVSNVERMSSMFEGATSFNQDISSWQTTSLTSILAMFKGASSFNQNLGAWDVSDLELAAEAFQNSGLTDENYNQMLIGWSTQDLFEGVTLDAPQNQYCDAFEARRIIIDNFNWTINDGGLATDCAIDTDNDGVLDPFDLCPSTPEGIVVNENGCDSIAADNLRIAVTSPSCPTSTDGSVQVEMMTPGYFLDISLTGLNGTTLFEDIPSDSAYSILNLSPGSYQISVSIPEILFERNFSITVNPIESIIGKRDQFSRQAKTVSYKVSGSRTYTVKVNGKTLQYSFNSTGENTITINNLSGPTAIEIEGERECQGKFTDQLIVDGTFSLYPTITHDRVFLIGNGPYNYSLHGADGQLLLTKSVADPQQFNEEIDLNRFATGIYFINILKEGNPFTLKVIKR